MLKILLFLSLILLELFSSELAVIGDKNFPTTNLTVQEIRAFFLGKKRYIGNSKILVMNHESKSPLRMCFEKNILEKTKRSLERYWRKAYYQGKRPPKIVSSTNMLFSYFYYVHPSIGYCDVNATVNQEVMILYRVQCE